MLHLTNIDGKIISLETVDTIVWDDTKQEMRFSYGLQAGHGELVKRFKGSNARQAYEWLLTSCVATFTDDESETDDNNSD